MALKDRMERDIQTVIINEKEFATWHTWNDEPILCVTAGEALQKRRNMNALDVAYLNPTHEVMVYVAASYFKRRPVAETDVYFDGQGYRIISVADNQMMYSIHLQRNDARSV